MGKQNRRNHPAMTLDGLERYLENHPDSRVSRVGVSFLDGFLAAIVVGPETVYAEPVPAISVYAIVSVWLELLVTVKVFTAAVEPHGVIPAVPNVRLEADNPTTFPALPEPLSAIEVIGRGWHSTVAAPVVRFAVSL